MAAFPPLIKTWQMSGAMGSTMGIPLVSGDQGWPLAVFPALTSFPLNPWVIEGSGNTVSGGLDGVNRWLTTGDIPVNAWICIRQPATGQRLVYQRTQSGNPSGTLWCSPRLPFTGGSASARPTSTEEGSIARNFFRYASDNGYSPSKALIWHASDGLQTMIVLHGVSGGDRVAMTEYLGNVHNAPKGWDYPSIAMHSDAEGRGPSAHDLIGSGANCPRLALKPLAAGGGIVTNLGFVTEGYDDGIILEPIVGAQAAYGSDALRDAASFGVFAHDGAGATLWHGFMGCWPDVVAFGRTSGEATAVGGNGNFPVAGDTSRIEIGQLIYPWDGSVWSS